MMFKVLTFPFFAMSEKLKHYSLISALTVLQLCCNCELLLVSSFSDLQNLWYFTIHFSKPKLLAIGYSAFNNHMNNWVATFELSDISSIIYP